MVSLGSDAQFTEVVALPEMDCKRVPVIGSSISGTDLSSSLASRNHYSKITNSMRHVPYVADRCSPVEAVDLMFNRLLVCFSRSLPDSSNSGGFIGKNYPNQLTEEITDDASLVTQDDLQNAGATLCSNYIENVKQGRLNTKLEAHSSLDKKITFKDGSTEEFDVVICASGYGMDLSQLPEDIRESVAFVNPFSGAQEVALYKHTLAPGWDNLAFAGQFNTFGAHFPTAEMQAHYISKVFKGEVVRPTDAKLEAGVERFKSYRLGGSHHVAEPATVIQEDIGDELGGTPYILSALWNPKRLLFGTIFPCCYRTNRIS